MADATDVASIVDAWIRFWTATEESKERENDRWANDVLLDWAIEGDAETLWLFVEEASARDIDPKTCPVLAAGPVEDLLAKFGPAYIDRVENIAREDPKFAELLGGVWRNSMTDDVWTRVQAIRKATW